ncbi:hypothetical protein ACJ8BD_00195 [Klebsiella pneumoniae]
MMTIPEWPQRRKGSQQGQQEGEQEATRSIAARMLARGLERQTVQEPALGLSDEELAALAPGARRGGFAPPFIAQDAGGGRQTVAFPVPFHFRDFIGLFHCAHNFQLVKGNVDVILPAQAVDGAS